MDKKYVLGGSVFDSQTNKGIKGLRVEVWDKNSNSKTAIASTHTDEKGEFKFTVDDSKPDVYFEVFEDNAKIYSTENKLIRSLNADKMDVKIPIDSSIIIGRKKLLKAEGYVYHVDTNPVSSINVVVSEKNIERKIEIAKGKTDSKGYYEIDFYSNQLKLNPKICTFSGGAR